MNKQKEQTNLGEISRDHRLDLVKAISIVFVLILHLRPIQIVMGDTPSNYTRIASFILDQVYLNSTLIAVPLFILTSLFLFLKKVRVLGSEYLIKRCKRLLEIFIFWMAMHFLIYYLTSILLSITTKVPFSWYIPKLRIYKVIAGVDPPLPIVGDSVFYFIFSLILLTLASYLFFNQRMDKLQRFKDFMGIGIIIISLIYFQILNFTGKYIAYWRPDNFIVYIPIAYFLIRVRGRIATKHTVTLYIFFLIFGLQDIFLRSMNKDVGLYARASIVCGSVAVFCSCLNLQNYRGTGSITFLSRFSLGLFAVHKYCLLLSTVVILQLFQLLNLPISMLVGGLEVSIAAIFSAVTALLCTLISIYFLDRSPLQRFIR